MFQVAFSVATVALVATPASANVFTYSSNLGTDSPDSFALNGRGSQTVAMTNHGLNFNSEVTVHTTTIGANGIEMSVPLAEFTPINEFGYLDLVGDHVTGDMLFVTEVNKLDSVVNIYQASWYGDEWSLMQTIAAPDNSTTEFTDPSYYFGSKFAVDHYSNRVIAVGYGDATPFLTYPVGYGKICVYEATSPAANQWLPTQVLTMSDAVSNNVLRLGGSFVNMHDDVIVTDTFHTTPDYRLEIFHRARNGLWSHQQSFSPNSATAHVTLSVVYDQTIVYAINDLTASGADLIGKSSVHIMHPNTPDYSSSHPHHHRRLDPEETDPKSKPKVKPKPTPKAIQWSLVQTLWSPNHDFVTISSGSDVGFGQDMGLHGNTLTVSEVGDGTNTGFLYVFERTNKIGMFSLQQTILPSVATNNYLSLHKLNNDVLMASSILTTNGASNDIWLGNNTAWGCLNIQLEDAFGDGWDGARLRVDTPFSAKDYFAPVCHTNPLVFRYCPSDFSQEGKYSFEIEGSKAAKFAWEIRWHVTEESSGTVYRGDHTTSMDFIFKNGKFKSGKVSHLLASNTTDTCQTCGGYPVPPKPKPKPKPKPTPKAKPAGPASSGSSSGDAGPGKPTPRRLHGSHGHTAAPSISPAPTLAVTANAVDWDTISMASAGGDWARDDYSGTHFYISDLAGQKLLSTGTLCGGELSGSCLQDLKDGQYILRVTGDLNAYKTDHTWTFCGRVGLASDSLTFEISNGVCVPLLRVTTLDACLVINPVSGYGVAAYTVALGSFVMAGATAEAMTTADKATFENAVVHTIPGAVSGGVSVLSVKNDVNNGGVVVSFSVQLQTQALGYDILDYNSLLSMFSMEQSQLSTSGLGQKMVSELLGGTLSGGIHSFFSNVVAVKLLSFQLGDLEFAKSPLVIESDEVRDSAEDVEFMHLVQSEANAAAAAQHATHMRQVYFDVGVGGYVLAAAAIAGMVVLVALKKRSVKRSLAIASDVVVKMEEEVEEEGGGECDSDTI
jgi:hypothetical protein